MKKSILAFCLWLSIIGMASLAFARTELVNTQQIELTGIASITIEYVSEAVQIMPGTGHQLILREYLSDDKRSYFAKIEQHGTGLSIKSGDRPWLGHLEGRIEVEIPVAFMGNLNLTTVSGKVELTSALNLNGLKVETTSGEIELDSLTVTDLQVKSISGKIELSKVFAQMTLNSTSGEIELEACRGPITASSTSGSINLRLDELLGNLNLRTVSGKIELRLPTPSAYSLRAETTSGAINLELDAQINKQERSAQAISNFEARSRQQIELRTTSGAIEVRQ